MGFFEREEPQENAQAEELARVEAGGIPLGAEERLKQLGRGGLVVGSSIYHIGLQIAAPTASRELDTLSQAMYSARTWP